MSQRRVANWLFILILLAAAFLRLYRLDEIPPGVTHDEADTGYFAAAVYRGEPSQVETPYGYAYQPFTMYSGALFMHLLGPNDLALRYHAAFWGMVLLVFTYLWTRRLFGAAVGLGSAAMVACSFWTVFDSRFALNSPPAPALFTAAAYFLWRALETNCKGYKESKLGVLCRSKIWNWGAFVLLLSASFYVYEAVLAAAVSFGLLLIYLALFDRPRFRRHAPWLAGALVVVGLLTAPHLLDPASWGRTNTLSGPVQSALRGDLESLMGNIVSTLGTFSISGDSFVTYNLPGRPIFDPVVSLFFYVGIATCIWRWRKPAWAFVLMWAVMGIVPTLLTGEWTSTLHSKAAESPIMALPALGAVEVGGFVIRRLGRRWGRVFAVVCALWLVVVAAFTGYDYFIRWGQSPGARAAYFHNATSIADYLDDTAYSGAVTLSSPFPYLPLDPLIADMRIHRDDLVIRWFDARRAVVFPNTQHSLLILPPNTPLDPYFAERLDLKRVERVELHPADVDPYFDVFEYYPDVALSRFPGSAGQTVIAGGRSLGLPVDFGGAVELFAYDLLTPEIAPDGMIVLVTLWRVRNPEAMGPVPATAYGRDAALFAHVLDEGDTIVGQEDCWQYAPAWNWRAGDALAQLHRFSVDASPGEYQLSVGIYNHRSLERLPVIIDGTALDDRVFLESLRVIGE